MVHFQISFFLAKKTTHPIHDLPSSSRLMAAFSRTKTSVSAAAVDIDKCTSTRRVLYTEMYDKTYGCTMIHQLQFTNFPARFRHIPEDSTLQCNNNSTRTVAGNAPASCSSSDCSFAIGHSIWFSRNVCITSDSYLTHAFGGKGNNNSSECCSFVVRGWCCCWCYWYHVICGIERRHLRYY